MIDTDFPFSKTALSALAVSLAACGGGTATGGTGGGAGGGTGGGSVTDSQAARFLHQAALNASDAEIINVKNLGYAGWIDAEIIKPIVSTSWDWLVSQGYNTIAFQNSVGSMDFAVWRDLFSANDALRKRVALALSEIFVVSSNGINVSSRQFAMAAYWDLLNTHAFGNYRSFIEALTLNPAMGVYLNTKGNQKEDVATGRAPDENYAREVLQLFSIGLYELNQDGTERLNAQGKPIETYGIDTVTNLARALTGWDFNFAGSNVTNPTAVRLPMVQTASKHSLLSATFLGTTIPANTAGQAALTQALNTITQHPNVAPFISKQLIQRLIASNPTPAFVSRIAAVFNNSNGVRGDMGAVVRAILLDTEARTPDTRTLGGKLREPMLRFVQWGRTFGASSASGAWQMGNLSDPSTRLGQSPLRASSVFNFYRPGYVPPNTPFATAGWVAPELQITNESSVAGYLNFMQNAINTGVADIVAPYVSELALVSDVNALLNRLDLLLCANTLSTATRATISTALAAMPISSASTQKNRVVAAVLLVMASPDYLTQR